MARSPARRPSEVFPSLTKLPPAPPPQGQLVVLPQPCDYQTAIAAICRASHPLGVDRAQRRRWLESHAEQQPTGDRKLAAVKAAAETIGFRFE